MSRLESGMIFRFLFLSIRGLEKGKEEMWEEMTQDFNWTNFEEDYLLPNSTRFLRVKLFVSLLKRFSLCENRNRGGAVGW